MYNLLELQTNVSKNRKPLEPPHVCSLAGPIVVVVPVVFVVGDLGPTLRGPDCASLWGIPLIPLVSRCGW